MQHVRPRWLNLYNYFLTGLDVCLFAAYFLLRQPSVSAATREQWGITPLILTIAAVHLVYSIFLYRFISKRSPWWASVVTMVMYGILLAAIIETSGNTNMVYRIAFAIFVFFSALTGPFVPVAAICLMWVLLVFTFVSLVGDTQATAIYNLVIDTVVTASGIAGWFVFRPHYVTTGNAEAIALSRLLEQEQFKANVMLESISDGVLVINTQGTVQVLNESAAEMLGWSKEEALKLDYRSLLQPIEGGMQSTQNQEAAIIIQKALSSQQTEQGVALIQTKNKRQLFVDIVVSPIFEAPEVKQQDAGNQKSMVGIIAILRDVDEQKRQEQQRSDFISTASHEMRTPVASIQGFIELALNPKVSTIDAKARGYLEKAHEATKHLGELFQDLLTVSKSDDGRLTNNPQVIEVGELLKEVVDQNKLAAEKKGLKVVLETTGATDDKAINPLLYVHVDPERLREVITNLFDNAIKYTQSGMITIGASLKAQSVVLRVADTGMGIAQEDIPHLFQKFYRTDNTATREIGGTGLGLYICKQIVEMMGGKVGVESTVGAGSTFYVEIPRVDPNMVRDGATTREKQP